MEEDIKNNDDFVYWNDEWNGQWIKDPKKFQWINPVHWLHEMYIMGKISKEELEIKLKNL